MRLLRILKVVNGGASNRQKKLLRFFGVKFRDSISIGAAGWEIARIMANEANRKAWRRYLYLTNDFDSDSDELKPFEKISFHNIEVPGDWSPRAAIDDFKEDLVSEFLKENSPCDLPAPSIRFFGRKFIFTGKFEFGTRDECQKMTESLGGLAPDQKAISHLLDYLVIGKLGNPQWSHGDEGYGNKISAAILARREHGSPIIISEDHWLKEIALAKGANEVEKDGDVDGQLLSGFSFHLTKCFSKSVLTKSFSVGDVIYDNPSGYETWERALAGIGVCLQIRAALPASLVGKGSVTADVFKPNGAKSALEKVGEFTVTQEEFIEVLKSGVLPKLEPQVVPVVEKQTGG